MSAIANPALSAGNNLRDGTESACLGLLSSLLFNKRLNGHVDGAGVLNAAPGELQYFPGFTEEDLTTLFELADVHHVTVRALGALKVVADGDGHRLLSERLGQRLAAEQQRISAALAYLDVICHGLERAGCPATVIKSLDHWPDLGGDLDLFTSGRREVLISTLTKKFGARVQPRSWGDRLAGKWNFQIPGLRELLEVHVKYLGQTGEHELLATRLGQRRRKREIGSYIFMVPAPEERIVAATLQRMYRHFYMRLCDITNIADLLRAKAIDFLELKKAAELGGIWPGIATLLVLVTEYVRCYGEDIDLPVEVRESAQFSLDKVYVQHRFLRIPIVMDGAKLYGRQLTHTAGNGDLRAVARLSLLPPLAIAAFISLKITKSDKGIW